MSNRNNVKSTSRPYIYTHSHSWALTSIKLTCEALIDKKKYAEKKSSTFISSPSVVFMLNDNKQLHDGKQRQKNDYYRPG